MSTKTTSPDDEIVLTLRVPKSAFTTIAPVPATVTQHTVEQHFGIPKRAYVRMVRDGLVACKKIGRLKIASYEDVRVAVTEGASTRTIARSDPTPRTSTGQTFDEDAFLKRVHARFVARVGRPMTDDEMDSAELWISAGRNLMRHVGKEWNDTPDEVAARVQSELEDQPFRHQQWKSLGLDPVKMDRDAADLRAKLLEDHPEMTWRERMHAVHEMWGATTNPLYEAQRKARAEKRAARKAEKAKRGDER